MASLPLISWRTTYRCWGMGVQHVGHAMAGFLCNNYLINVNDF
jgi:hypothetical protein